MRLDLLENTGTNQLEIQQYKLYLAHFSDSNSMYFFCEYWVTLVPSSSLALFKDFRELTKGSVMKLWISTGQLSPSLYFIKILQGGGLTRTITSAWDDML